VGLTIQTVLKNLETAVLGLPSHLTSPELMVIRKIKELPAHWLSTLRFGQLECWFWFQLVKAEIRTATGTWFTKTGSGFETAARMSENKLFLRKNIWNWGLTGS
jgi:hypothetical protein